MKIIKCVLVLVFLAGVVVLSMSCSNARDNDALRISVTQENPLNMEQHSASIKMGVSDSRIYFSNDNELFFLSNGHLEKIAEINANIFALVGDYVYCNMVRPDYSGEVDFYCYSIPDHIQTYLFTTTEIVKNRDVFFQQGNLFIPVDRSCTHFYSVVDGQITDTDAESPKWGICGNTYTFVYKKDEQEFICYRDNESMQTPENVLPYGFETVVECNNGLLIHNEGQGDLLYFIEGDTGELVELFTVDCMRSISAVNVYQTNIYLSFC